MPNFKVILFVAILNFCVALCGPVHAASPQEGAAAQSVPYIWRAQDVVDAIGVVTHVGYDQPGSAYANLDLLFKSLQWLGVTNVREALPVLPLSDPRWLRTYALFDTGMKASLIAYNTPGYTAGYPTVIAAMKASLDNLVRKYPGQVLDMEGLNEPTIVDNKSLFHYGTLSGAEAVAQYQIDLYDMIKGDPLLAGLPVWEFNLNTPPYDQTMYDQIYQANPAVMKAFDVASRGAYGGYWSPIFTIKHEMVNPFDVGWDPNKQAFVHGPLNSALAGRPLVVKETGLSAAPNGLANPSVSDWIVQGKLMPSILFDTFVLGSQRSYIYELADLYNKPNNNLYSYYYGIFDNAWNPKPAARVLRNIIAYLKDPASNASSFTPQTMNVSVHQFPLKSPGAASQGSGLTLRTQSANGNYHIIVWYEPLLWDRVTNAEFPAPAPVPITLGLSGNCARTSVYDPYFDTTTVGPSHISQIPIALPDHAIIVTCEDPS